LGFWGGTGDSSPQDAIGHVNIAQATSAVAMPLEKVGINIILLQVKMSLVKKTRSSGSR